MDLREAKASRETMRFCPLCFNMLMVEASVSNVRLFCHGCKYYYPLDKPIRSRVVIAKRKAL
jgi:DNA-directed RNA polymerase subunit M/transcription elongation factor TFIIS